MTEFEQIMQSDPPRLVVTFQRADDGREGFRWGIAGKGAFPILNAIGAVVRAQVALCALDEWFEECDGRALALIWGWGGEFRHFVDPSVPTESLVGFLEIVRMNLLAAQAQQQAQQQERGGIVGPDGRPVRGGGF